MSASGLVSKKTLQRRHPDMIWSADTVKGGRVLFLLEFQRTVERLMAQRTAVEKHEDPELDGFMVQTMDTMLTLRDYPEELMKGGAKTMAEVVDRFRQGMDELVQRGRTEVLHRQAARKFGEETAGRLSRLMTGLSGPDDIDQVTDALIECGTGEEFIDRVRMA